MTDVLADYFIEKNLPTSPYIINKKLEELFLGTNPAGLRNKLTPNNPQQGPAADVYIHPAPQE